MRAINLDGVPAAPVPKKVHKKTRDVLTYVPKPEQKASSGPKPAMYFYGGTQTLSVTSWQAGALLDVKPEEVLAQAALEADAYWPDPTGDEPWMVRMRQRRQNKKLFGRTCTDAELPQKLQKQKAKTKP